MDFDPHRVHCKCIMKGSSNGNGQYEQKEGGKTVSILIWAVDCCFKTELKKHEPVLYARGDIFVCSSEKLEATSSP